LANLYIGVSAPCGVVSQSLGVRENPLEDAYNQPNDCKFKSYQGSLFHPYYFDTGYKVKELQVLAENGVLD
jgi:hypothetical protein